MDEKCTEIPDLSNRYCLLGTCRASLPCGKSTPDFMCCSRQQHLCKTSAGFSTKDSTSATANKDLVCTFYQPCYRLSSKICRMLWSFIPNASKSYTAWVVSLSEFVESHLSLVSFSVVVPDLKNTFDKIASSAVAVFTTQLIFHIV